MDDITTQFEECLRRHLRSAKPNPINYDVELVQIGLDSMTAVAVLMDMAKTFGIRFPDDHLQAFGIGLRRESVADGGVSTRSSARRAGARRSRYSLRGYQGHGIRVDALRRPWDEIHE